MLCFVIQYVKPVRVQVSLGGLWRKSPPQLAKSLFQPFEQESPETKVCDAIVIVARDKW